MKRNPIFSIAAAGHPFVIAHRGARSAAPENTLPALELALKYDVEGIEFDVDLSSDDVPFLIHQETLQASADGSALELARSDLTRAWTLQLTSQALSRIDAGRWFSDTFSGVQIPTMEAALSLDWQGKVAIAELKDPYFWADSQNRTSGPRIVRAVKEYCRSFVAAGGNLSLLSFSPHILELCAEEFAEVPRVYAIWTDKSDRRAEVISEVKSLKVSAVTLADTMLVDDPKWIEEIHAAGAAVWAYDVSPDSHDSYREWLPENRRPVWLRLAQLGVDAIESDFPLELSAILAERKSRAK